MIKKYQDLMEQAARRERKALWRVERQKLAMRRMQLLEEDQQLWDSEIAARKAIESTTQLIDISTTDNPPFLPVSTDVRQINLPILCDRKPFMNMLLL